MSDEEEDKRGRRGKNTPRDQQKSHLEKLMADPDKPVAIPEGPKRKKMKEPPEFVRFYMGSSAGAGSEVFHVYRHLRRRENMRQQFIDETAENEDLEEEFQEKLASNRMVAIEKTSKKRAKRLKRKEKQKVKKSESKKVADISSQECSSSSGGKQPAEKEQDREDDEEPHFVIGGR